MNTVTMLPSLQSATNDVCREFKQLNIYTDKLDETSVSLSYAPWNFSVNGHYDPNNNSVTVPALSTSAAFGPYCSLRDVLRHEFGHALLDHSPRLISAAEWKKIFGAPRGKPSPYEYDEEDFITPYANSGATVEEDFCELLMVWVRHKGDIKRYRYSRPGVYAKLQFVASVMRKLH
jgi:hypothetical protein